MLHALINYGIELGAGGIPMYFRSGRNFPGALSPRADACGRNSVAKRPDATDCMLPGQLLHFIDKWKPEADLPDIQKLDIARFLIPHTDAPIGFERRPSRYSVVWRMGRHGGMRYVHEPAHPRVQSQMCKFPNRMGGGGGTSS